MNERDLIKNIIEFSFLIKAQLSSDETALLRSALSIVIMEAEDILEAMELQDEPSASSSLIRRNEHAREA